MGLSERSSPDSRLEMSAGADAEGRVGALKGQRLVAC